MKNLLEDEAITVGGSNHSHATQDLYDAIAAGDYPEWKLLIQVCLTAYTWADNATTACSIWCCVLQPFQKPGGHALHKLRQSKHCTWWYLSSVLACSYPCRLNPACAPPFAV